MPVLRPYASPTRLIPLNVSATRTNGTLNPDFSRHVQNSYVASIKNATAMAESVAPYIPGAAVLSAALHSATPANAGAGLGLGAGAFGSNSANPIQSMAQMQQKMITENREILALQQQTNMSNRRFTTISNIYAADNQAKKNAIQNLH